MRHRSWKVVFTQAQVWGGVQYTTPLALGRWQGGADGGRKESGKRGSAKIGWCEKRKTTYWVLSELV